MTTLRVKVVCNACKGEGLIRQGRWDEDKYTYQRTHTVVESDCEACGGAGHNVHTIMLDAEALAQLSEALAGHIRKATSVRSRKTI